MLKLENIKKSYKTNNYQVRALDGINLSFQDTGMIFIVGKSGSGKSTLLNIIGGLDKQDSGNIIINGKSTSNFSRKDFDAYRNYNVGFIFQEFNLIDELSVKENITLDLKIQSLNHDLIDVDEALKLVGLEGLGYRNIKELSGGQKQRVAIARALIKNPSIILADEPTGALDYKTSYELFSSLKTLSLTKLVIVVTHDDEFAYEFADEIISLNDGKISSHLALKEQYKHIKNEIISQNVIKIASGNEIDSENIINDLIDHNKDYYVNLIDNPELVSIAYPDLYDKIYKKDNLIDKYTNKEIKEENDSSTYKDNISSSHISYKECFKMAFNQYKNKKARTLFLLIFSIIAICIIGLSYSLFFVNNSKVVGHTLKNNNISLAMMEKYNKHGKEILNENNKNELNEKYQDTSFALAKEYEFSYTSSNQKESSAFEMKKFRGLIECDDVSKLNLDLVAGSLKFNENSINNNEIIISDYAAYELRRTGYLGYDNLGNYGLIMPNNVQEQINSYVTLNNIDYKIIGVFDTNYEDYLPLLISETYVENQEGKQSSLESLKTYYYSRLFVPNGFYKNYIDNYVNLESINSFAYDVKDVPLYPYNNETNTIEDKIEKLVNLQYYNFSSFMSFDDVKNNFSYDVIYGKVPSSLNDNQVILSYDWLSQYGFNFKEQIEAAIDSINKKSLIARLIEGSKLGSILYDNNLEVVAVIDIDDTIIDPHELVYHYYHDVAIMFSNNLKTSLDNSIYSYDQMFFTLDGSLSNYIKQIKNIENEGYNVLNINGDVSFNNSTIESIRSISYIVSIIMLVFTLLIMSLFVSSSIKERKKEIGILKALGAKNQDVLRIYLIEEGILAIITIIISLVIIRYGINQINASFADIRIKMELVSFDILTVLFVFIITLLLYIISTIIPLIKILKMKPVEAISRM